MSELRMVAASVLVDSDGRILLTKRPQGKSLAGLWEFPGGKMETGESPESCLRRELNEELGIDVSVACLSPLTFASHFYEEEDFRVLLLVYLCMRWEGVVCAMEGQEMRWVGVRDLNKYEMPAADVSLQARLRDWL